MFSLGGITGSPTLFDGVGIGGVYFAGERLALRGTLGFQIESTSVDYASARINDKQSKAGVAFAGGVEYIVSRFRNLNIWMGGLLRVATASFEDVQKNETSDKSVSLSGVLGADWFFAENVSLGAEYGIGVQRSSRDVDPDGPSNNEVTTQTQLGVAATGLRLGFWW